MNALSDIRAIYYWRRLRDSFWFLPLIMAVAGGVLAVLCAGPGDAVLRRLGLGGAWFYDTDADVAREFLATLVQASITVTSLVFSLSLVALSQVSTQLGPRLINRFRKDRFNQIVLGALAGTFVFSLIALRDVPSASEGPYLAVPVALVLALISFALLIYFIHHVAGAIRVDAVIADVGRDLDGALARLLERGGDEPPPLGEGEDEGAAVSAHQAGYIEAVDYGRLIAAAARADAVILVDRRAGHFVLTGLNLARVVPASQLDDELEETIRRAIVTGPERTMTQDVEFAVGEMVEVALRALSAAMNDPRSAITCIDRLAAAIGRVLEGKLPPARMADEDGTVRVVADVVTFDGLVDAAFDQIRQAAAGHPAVIIRLLEILADLGGLTDDAGRRRALGVQVDSIATLAAEVPDARDRRDVEAWIDTARRALAAA